MVLYEGDTTQGAREVGKFKWSNDTVYIDLNAGIFSEKDVGDVWRYTALRTFAHELTHFGEKWNAGQYDVLRTLVFEELDNRGVDVDALIRAKAEQLGLSYDMESREVVEDSMADMLADPKSTLLEKLAQRDTNAARALLSKLQEFLTTLKNYFASLNSQSTEEARLLQDQIGYTEELVQAWEDLIAGAVERYNPQKQKAKTETKTEVKKEVKEEVKAETKETKTQEVKAEVKEEVKEEVKVEETEEPKAEEPKLQTIEEKQAEEAKPEPKSDTVAQQKKKPETATIETTEKIEDFGEKIGGARKDLWRKRGLLEEDLEEMNERERSDYVKKDNVWKRPNYKALVEAGGDRGLLYVQNEIRKLLNQKPEYSRSNSMSLEEQQSLFVSTIREIQQLAENAKSAEDLRNMGIKWGLENGYLEDTGKTYGRYRNTEKFYNNPALYGSSYFNGIETLANVFDKRDRLADKDGFAVDAKSKVPKGYAINQSRDGTWYIAKGRFIIKDGFASFQQALETLQNAVKAKKTKTKFIPAQLQGVHRKGLNYRRGQDVSGQDYMDTFGFKGGEYGNWMSQKDRQVSLNYGFDALKDMAAALGIPDTDISFGGKLNIAFGSRGVAGAAAHYEPQRQVINLTKMNGAGSLAHEWFHALDDFIGGYVQKMASDNPRSLPERSAEAMRKLVQTMRYRSMTDSEADLERTKQLDSYHRRLRNAVEYEFGFMKKLEAGTLSEMDTKHYKRKPTAEDLSRYQAARDALAETGDTKQLDVLSELRKEITGRVIPKESRDRIGYAAIGLQGMLKNGGVSRGNVKTDFYTQSTRFGEVHNKDGDYWDSTIEMIARAFAVYVNEKTGKNNDYLSAHAEAYNAIDIGKDGQPTVIRAYPVGEERVAINQAFDELFAALKADSFLHERTETETVEDVVQYAKQGEDIEQSSVQGYNVSDNFYWAVNDGVISSDDQRVLEEAVERIHRGFKGFPETHSGERIVDAGNSLLFVKGTHAQPELTKVIYFYSYSDNQEHVDTAKEMLIYAEQKTAGGQRLSYNVIEDIYGDGDVNIRVIQNNKANERQNGRRKRADGKRSNRKNILEERMKADGYVFDHVLDRWVKLEEYVSDDISDSQFAYQTTKALSDRDILEMAAGEIQVDGLNDQQKQALQNFKDRLDKLGEIREKIAEQKQIRELEKANGKDTKKTTGRIAELNRRAKALENEIATAEDSELYKNILKKARATVERIQRAEFDKRLAKYRMGVKENQTQSKYRGRVTEQATALMDILTKPDTKDIRKRIPVEHIDSLSVSCSQREKFAFPIDYRPIVSYNGLAQM